MGVISKLEQISAHNATTPAAAARILALIQTACQLPP
jgi:hypothetical protein